MSAFRLPLLCAFAGGCLSNALLFGVWRVAEGASSPSVTQPQPPARVVQLVSAPTVAPSVEQSTDLGATKPPAPAQDDASEPALTQPTQAVNGSGAAPVGSSVSDVLMGLEEAYRQRLGARAQTGQDPASAPVAEARTVTEPARSVAAEPAAQVIPVISNVTPPAAVVPVAAVVPAAAVNPAVEPPQFAALPAAAQDASRPSETHYGDVNQNTYVTNIRQGDVYQIQLQQLVMLQYLQQLAVPSGPAAPARHLGGGAHPRSTPFSSGITNPDNPWGFRFAPPNLVR